MFGDDRRPVSAAAPAVRRWTCGRSRPPRRSRGCRCGACPCAAISKRRGKPSLGRRPRSRSSLVADGATAAQVPAITLPDVSGVQAFADPPQVEEQFVEGRPRPWFGGVSHWCPSAPARPSSPAPAWPGGMLSPAHRARPCCLRCGYRWRLRPGHRPGGEAGAAGVCARTHACRPGAGAVPTSCTGPALGVGVALAAIAAITVLVVVRQRRVRDAASGASGARGGTGTAGAAAGGGCCAAMTSG